MKTKIIIGSLLAICLLISVPSIPAVEYNAATNFDVININECIFKIKKNIEEINKQLKNRDNKEFYKKLQEIYTKELKNTLDDFDLQKIFDDIKIKNDGSQKEPKFIIALTLLRILLRIINFIVSLGGFIAITIINTIAMIIFLIVVIINLIISTIVFIIKLILSTIISIIDTIIQTIYDIIFQNEITVVSSI